MNLFKKINIPENLIVPLQEREMAVEHSINRFRIAFFIIIAVLDTISSIVIKGIKLSERYEILGMIVGISGIILITFIYLLTRKGKKFYGFIKFLSVTLDLSITFAFAFGALFWMDFPIPVSKETFILLVTIIFMFFNSLSVLRTDKKIVIYSGILTLMLNAVLFVALYFFDGNKINMAISYSSFFIILLSIFNLWVSEQILKSFMANKQLELANDEINRQKNQIEGKNEELNQLLEEITTQRDEIEAQRDTVEEQKQHIEVIHKEVEQSIDYATRLQGAILPEETVLSKYVSDHFVLFKPKDKVSGDFYWWTHIENHTIITAADCTGHGVPGAFMSMLGASFLREIVEKEFVTHTGVILRKLRKEIIKALKQKGEMGEQKDGMDMAIISINHETNVVKFSGANNPLYVISNRQLDNIEPLKDFENFYEITADKMPIAIYDKMDSFVAHELHLQKGDQLYMFSDGFADQFGGAKGKKFKYKPFKRLLSENRDKSMKEQKELLDKAFDDWRGDLEQIDDVVVLGIKI